mmetsp:Transcript_1772/g.3079  ORF Transcript_1772/g.3079 Transcript_1772/m.3079 type:complete len:529 (-) Transcript_1772:109-1695(-)
MDNTYQRMAEPLAPGDDFMQFEDDSAGTSPAYKALREAGLIVHLYEVRTTADLDLVSANSSMSNNLCKRATACVVVPVLGGLLYSCAVREFSVTDGHIRCGTHSNGSYYFFGAGVHRIVDPFLTVDEWDKSLTSETIVHGNRTIATVPQGFVGLAFDRGQPVILPPGLHQWKSETLKLQEMIDLSAPVIRIGPFTLLTVDEGYAAVTQDNGKQKVLEGGHTHMLMHRNWKFESFMSLKIHTEDLGPFSATTADSVVLTTTATVNWRIQDPSRAARMAADTMKGEAFADRCKADPNANPTLRQDVLKQALASLAAAIGNVRYAGDAHISASKDITVMSLTSVHKMTAKMRDEFAASQTPSSLRGGPTDSSSLDMGLASIFSVNQMTAAVRHANEICSQYGVCIMNINIVSAFPEDASLTKALSAGAVASASAEQAEMASRGNAKAKLIQSQAAGEAMRISARADAEAERVRAQGKQDAAALLKQSQVATDLALMERTSQLMSPNSTFFFGAGQDNSAGLLANPNLSNWG